MINKKIIHVMKIVFITTLTISFNSSKNMEQSFKETDPYKTIGIDEAKKTVENDIELQANFFNLSYIDELLQTHTKLCFEFYKKKSEKKITIEDFNAELKNNKNDIKKFLIKEPIEFLEEIIEKKFSKESPNQEAMINLLEIKTELGKMILNHQIPNIQNKFTSILILPEILKIKKEEEMKIEAHINNYYNEKNNKENPVEKPQKIKTIEVMKYIYSQPKDQQQEIINSLDFGLFESFRCGDVTPLKKYIEEGNRQLKNSSDDPDIHSEAIENLRNEIKQLLKKIDELSTESNLNKKKIEDLEEKLNAINRTLEMHKNSTDKNITKNEIKIINEKIAELEKKNNQYLYLIITLACPVIFMLYKYIFPSDEN